MIYYYYIYNVRKNGFLHVDGQHNMFEWHDEVIILRDFYSTHANYYNNVSSAIVTCKYLCDHERVEKKDLIIVKSNDYTIFNFDIPVWVGLVDAF